MSLIFTRTIRLGNTLTDADPTPTLGIVRVDTSAVVVAAGTAMTHDATGRYSYTLASPVAGVTYRANYTIVVSGRTISSSSEKVASDASATWYYADEQSVIDLIGTEALRAVSNEPGASSSDETDSVRVTRVGLWSDHYIDGRMAALGYVTPMTGMDGGTTALMKDISAKMVAFKLNEPRMLTSITGNVRLASSIDTIMDAHWKTAEMQLRQIGWRQLAITADRLYTRQPFAKVYLPTITSEIAAAQARAIQIASY